MPLSEVAVSERLSPGRRRSRDRTLHVSGQTGLHRVLKLKSLESVRLPVASRDRIRKWYKVFRARPVMTCEWDVTRRLSSVVRRPYVVPVPYSTCVSPGSFVFQLIVTRVDFADAVGWEMTGPVVPRAAFATVTLTPADVLTFPAASRATAVRTWAPSAIVAELQVVAYGGVVTSTPRFAPSILN